MLWNVGRLTDSLRIANGGAQPEQDSLKEKRARDRPSEKDLAGAAFRFL